MEARQAKTLFALFVLLGINTMNFFDRQVLAVVQELLKKEWHLSDAQLGWGLGSIPVLLYAAVGLPVGRWVDTGKRTRILAGGAALWSVLTAACGIAWDFTSLFALRMGVGASEASCAPTSTSLLGDLFPAHRRARAIAVFMIGLPLGLGLSFLISGRLAQQYGWRTALYVAGGPGMLFALMALFIAEPARGATEKHHIGAQRRAGSPLFLVLGIPTMWWLIASGAIHNFNMYAQGQFLSSFMMRYHGLSVAEAGKVNGIVYGLGGLGILFGGWACDLLAKRRISGRLEVATLALAVYVPSWFIALAQPPGNAWAFALCVLPGIMLSYVYYAGVYAAIQDIVEPALRGTAMAVYFFAMYALGAALGPGLCGNLSDYLARQAAGAAGLSELNDTARAIGLYQAMYLLPSLGIMLVLVLFAASRTVTKDYLRLQKWMETSGQE